MSEAHEPTLAACLTPPGTGAIATLALHGLHAWDVVRALWHDGARLPDHPTPGRFWLGRLGADLADEVVLAVRTMTPVPWVEVHCHGGAEVVRLLLEAFTARGVQTCSWQEFECRTQPFHAPAAIELVKAPTTRTAAILLDQYHGAFDRSVRKALDTLHQGDRDRAFALVEELERFAPVGRHLTEPWRVVVVGPTNVGKSSLVNALAGFQRSVVSATPGTTRDVVTTRIAVDGWPVELADTAGLREGAADLEGQGIDRARAAARTADLRLWILDASAAPVWPDVPRDDGESLVRFVINKVDLPAAWDLSQAPEGVHVSARTGAGLAELCRSLVAWLIPEAPPAGAAVPFTTALAEGVEEARRRLSLGQMEQAMRVLQMLRGEREA